MLTTILPQSTNTQILGQNTSLLTLHVIELRVTVFIFVQFHPDGLRTLGWYTQERDTINTSLNTRISQGNSSFPPEFDFLLPNL